MLFFYGCNRLSHLFVRHAYIYVPIRWCVLHNYILFYMPEFIYKYTIASFLKKLRHDKTGKGTVKLSEHKGKRYHIILSSLT